MPPGRVAGRFWFPNNKVLSEPEAQHLPACWTSLAPEPCLLKAAFPTGSSPHASTVLSWAGPRRAQEEPCHCQGLGLLLSFHKGLDVVLAMARHCSVYLGSQKGNQESKGECNLLKTTLLENQTGIKICVAPIYL